MMTRLIHLKKARKRTSLLQSMICLRRNSSQSNKRMRKTSKHFCPNSIKRDKMILAPFQKNKNHPQRFKENKNHQLKTNHIHSRQSNQYQSQKLSSILSKIHSQRCPRWHLYRYQMHQLKGCLRQRLLHCLLQLAKMFRLF